MAQLHCPGTDLRYWKPEDITYQPCPECGAEVEVWKDEPVRLCQKCKGEVHNQKLDMACAKWCPHAKECPGAQSAKSQEANVAKSEPSGATGLD